MATVAFVAVWATCFNFHPDFKTLYVKNVITFPGKSFQPFMLLKIL